MFHSFNSIEKENICKDWFKYWIQMLTKNFTGGKNYKLNNILEQSDLDTGTNNKPARIKQKIVFFGKHKVHKR